MQLELIRPTDLSKSAPNKKSQLGQFMTPVTVARFMVSLFPVSSRPLCRLLDPGAGEGALTNAFLERCASGGFGFQRVEVEAYEIDVAMRARLKKTLADAATQCAIQARIVPGDFIEQAVEQVRLGHRHFTHAILNPPYKKINSDSPHRLALRRAGIETVNLYSAFVALALSLLEKGGQLVAIIPRSFCNGPYYRPFRELVLKQAAIRQLHLFEARDKAFRSDDVLQENIILRLERGGQQGDVTISTSTDDSLVDYAAHVQPFEQIVFPEDPEHFIHVPTSAKRRLIDESPTVHYALADLGIDVSTGPVVDFRLRAHLRDDSEAGTVPLLYPGHFTHQAVEWPKSDWKKPNAVVRNTETEKWLYPVGVYVVVRRFSAKEEKRRIVASVVEPKAFPDATALGFENHLNVFHAHRQGLPESLACGLAAFLNSTAVDDDFRRFNGHTQVNATDLRRMNFPSRETLIVLGKWAQQQGVLTQELIDHELETLIT